MAASAITVLGEVTAGDLRGVRSVPLSAQPLLAAIVCSRRQRIHRDELLAMLWPEMDVTRSRRRLNTALWRLRHALDGLDGEADEHHDDDGTSAVVTTRCGSLQLNRDAVEVDAQALLNFQAESPSRLATVCDTDFEDAVSVDPNELFAGCYHDVVVGARVRLRSTQMRLLSQLCMNSARSGDLPSAIHWARRILDQDPYREDVHRILIRALRGAGRPRDAQQQFEYCRALLRADLGVDPQPETAAAFSQPLDLRSAPRLINDAPEMLAEVVTVLTSAAAQLQKTLDYTTRMP